MKEIEILMEVQSCKADCVEALKRFTFKGSAETIDVYFYDPLRPDLQPDANGRLRRSFRVRRKGNGCFMAYKEDHFGDNDEWIYSDEHETSIGGMEEALGICAHLGLCEMVRVVNTKHTYVSDCYEIVLEEVRDLGLFVEVEYIPQVEDESVDNIRRAIRAFLEGVGIKLGREMNAGKPEMLLAKQRNGSHR